MSLTACQVVSIERVNDDIQIAELKLKLTKVPDVRHNRFVIFLAISGFRRIQRNRAILSEGYSRRATCLSLGWAGAGASGPQYAPNR